MKTMNGESHGNRRFLDVTSTIGILVGVSLLLPAFIVPELTFLAAPASAVLVLGLMYESR